MSNKKLNTLIAQKNRLELSINKEKKNARKERTRRLIQKGALLEKYLESEHLSIVETEELLRIYSNYINDNKPQKFKKDD